MALHGASSFQFIPDFSIPESMTPVTSYLDGSCLILEGTCLYIAEKTASCQECLPSPLFPMVSGGLSEKQEERIVFYNRWCACTRNYHRQCHYGLMRLSA